MKDLGQYIKHKREENGLTQLALAKKLGFEIPQFVSLMENGHSKIPLNVLKKLIPILGLDKKKVVKILVTYYTDYITKEI